MAPQGQNGFEATPPPSDEWKFYVKREFESRQLARLDALHYKVQFPLIAETYDADDVVFMMEPMMNGQLTLHDNVRAFEKKFAAYTGAKYAVMVNSGSSANLLALSAMMSHTLPNPLKPGDEILCPAVCWSTSLWPIAQLGMVPVLVDVDGETLNMSVADMKAKITPKTRGVMMVHVLGNCSNMDEMMGVCRDHGLKVLEDTCESLGSRWKGKMLGTLGDTGQYSFYFSHHITTGEGGAVVTNDKGVWETLKCMRAHGWSRDMSDVKELEAQNPGVDPRFLFVNHGYNLRPMEISGALGLRQLDRVDRMNAARNQNRAVVAEAIRAHPGYSQQFELIGATDGCSAAWFGFVFVLHEKYAALRSAFAAHLEAHGVQNRPIISGNFAGQPALRAIGLGHIRTTDFPEAEQIGQRGLFIGLRVTPMPNETVHDLVEKLLGFDFREPVLPGGNPQPDASDSTTQQDVVLVTGGTGTVGQGLRALLEKDRTLAQSRKWVFVGSKDANLRDFGATLELFEKYRPTHVLHLAAFIKGRHEMAKAKSDVLCINMEINQNVLKAARAIGGVRKVVSCLSSVAYPADTTREGAEDATEKDLHAGPPHDAVIGYAHSKRLLDVLSRTAREQHGCDFVTVCPTNIFGPTHSLRMEGPMFEANIAKCLEAKASGGEYHVWGSGRAVRQMLYSEDLARLLVWALDHYTDAETVNLTGAEVSVKDVAEAIAAACGFRGDLVFDADKPEGPARVAISGEKLAALHPGYEATPFAEAVGATVASSLANVRGENPGQYARFAIG